MSTNRAQKKPPERSGPRGQRTPIFSGSDWTLGEFCVARRQVRVTSHWDLLSGRRAGRLRPPSDVLLRELLRDVAGTLRVPS